MLVLFIPYEYMSHGQSHECSNTLNKNLYETLKNNYINLKKEKKIDIVLTRISNMVNFLKSEKISFDFLFPSEENIKNTVLEVIKDIKI